MATINRAAYLLSILAEQCAEKLSGDRTAYMISALSKYNAADVCAALESLIQTARRFPTLAEIRNAMGESTNESKGREIGERIWAAICKFGSTRDFDRVAEYVGPIGVEVIRMQGGWQAICDTATYDNAGQMKSQWRELAVILASKGPDRVTEAPSWSLPERTGGGMRLLGGGGRVLTAPTGRPNADADACEPGQVGRQSPKGGNGD